MCKNTVKQRLLVSIRGPKEALNAYRGGAHIIDVEYPASALGTPYPLNIRAVRNAIPKRIEIATNIGEEQRERRSTACQAVLGVALAGADIIKAGLAGYSYKEARYLGDNGSVGVDAKLLGDALHLGGVHVLVLGAQGVDGGRDKHLADG